MSISEFVARHQFVMNQLKEDCLLDLARNDRLPLEVKLQRYDEIEKLKIEKSCINDADDEWRKHCRRPLSYVTVAK